MKSHWSATEEGGGDMSRYIIELWGCAEVHADDKWEAFSKAWGLFDSGEVQITEASVIDIEDDSDETHMVATESPVAIAEVDG